MEAIRLLRLPEVVERTGLSPTSIWRREREGEFPPGAGSGRTRSHGVVMSCVHGSMTGRPSRPPMQTPRREHGPEVTRDASRRVPRRARS